MNGTTRIPSHKLQHRGEAEDGKHGMNSNCYCGIVLVSTQPFNAHLEKERTRQFMETEKKLPLSCKKRFLRMHMQKKPLCF